MIAHCRHEIDQFGAILCRSGKHPPYPARSTRKDAVGTLPSMTTTTSELEALTLRWGALTFAMAVRELEACLAVAAVRSALTALRRDLTSAKALIARARRVTAMGCAGRRPR